MKQRFIQISALSFLLFGLLTNTFAQERYVRPVDEGKKDKSFSIFRDKLIEAVKKRDKKYLLIIVDPKIKSSFGGDDGIKDFKAMWKIDSSKTKLWDELRIVLSNGGTFIEKNTFAAPYSFNSFPDDVDVFEYQMIFGNNVNLRAKPDLSANVISQLSYNIVKVDYGKSISDGGEEPIYKWLNITTLGGKTGFISADFVRSPIDFRAIFEKKKGTWKMTAFVAGD